MWLLIGVNRTGERVQDEFESQDDLYECVSSKFEKRVSVDNRNEPQQDLKDRLMEACRQNSLWADPFPPFVYQPEKEGTYVIAHNAKRGLETLKIFFVCEAEQK